MQSLTVSLLLSYQLRCFTPESYFLDLSLMGYRVLQNEDLFVEETVGASVDVRVIGRRRTLRELLISKAGLEKS